MEGRARLRQAAAVERAAAGLPSVTDTIFFQKSARMFVVDFGRADDGRDIAREISTRMGPSLAIALPIFILGLFVTVSFRAAAGLLPRHLPRLLGRGAVRGDDVDFRPVLHHRRPVPDQQGLAPGADFRLSPTASTPGRFLILPVLHRRDRRHRLATRWYRTIFLEEIGKDYVRTARAKGLSETVVLFRHVLRNALIPILTGVVVVIPLLFMGSLLIESFFGIPGLGSYTIDAINAQDFAVVRSMVFIGSVLYIVGLMLTDISYTLVDPRIRFE